MEFSLTDEQLMIQETAANFLAHVSDSQAVRQVMASECGYDATVWQQLCTELYMHALIIPEEYGGMGLSYVELVCVLEQMGRRLFCAPYFATVCLATNALLIAATQIQQEKYFAEILATKTATLAFNDASGNWDVNAISVTYEKIKSADKKTQKFILNGEYRYVIDGHSADILILAARQKNSQGTDGISLFICDANNAAIQRSYLPSMDQTRKQAHIKLNNLTLSNAHCMKQEGSAWFLLEKILQLAVIAQAAEQVGGAQQVLDLTLDYMRERQQFNRSIASFQALKHKAADMQLKVEVGRSAIYYAACVAAEYLKFANGNNAVFVQLPEAASIAKAHCSDAFFYCAGSAIQMHGGVGFAWEYDVHLYFKRAKATQLFLGDSEYHRELIAQYLLDEQSEHKNKNSEHKNKKIIQQEAGEQYQ